MYIFICKSPMQVILTRSRPKMHFSFSAVNKKCWRKWNSILVKKRTWKRNWPVPMSHNLVTVQLRTWHCRPNANDIFGTKTKNKTRMGIFFRLKRKKTKQKWPNRTFWHRKRISVGCIKIFLDYHKYASVTCMLLDLGLPSVKPFFSVTFNSRLTDSVKSLVCYAVRL